MILVTGGSGSGKSEYAENLAVDIARKKEPPKYVDSKVWNDAERIEADRQPLLYVATMTNYGNEAEERIARHQRLRAGKGFETLESMYLEEDIDCFRNQVVLLEDLSNLLSNYMYMKSNQDKAVDIIYNKLIAIDNVCRELIIVTNEVFSDGNSYDQSVMDFIINLAALNRSFAKISRQFTEVVYGIPVMIKL